MICFTFESINIVLSAKHEKSIRFPNEEYFNCMMDIVFAYRTLASCHDNAVLRLVRELLRNCQWNINSSGVGG